MRKLVVQMDLKHMHIVNVEGGIVNVGQSWQRRMTGRRREEMAVQGYPSVETDGLPQPPRGGRSDA